MFLHSTINPNDTKITTYSNLSKLIYKDGLILKDAVNSNPGYGLWSIKLSEENKLLKKVNEEDNNLINSYNSNIYSNKLFNNVNNIKINENYYSNNNDKETFEILDTNYYEERVDNMVINKLTKRSNKLENKYKDMLYKYYEQENLFLNLEKIKKEYEQLVNESIKEKNEIQKKCLKLDNYNQALMNSISNVRKEIERLTIVIREEQSKVQNKVEDFNKKSIFFSVFKLK